MSHLLKAAKLTADMIQRRDDIKLLYGKRRYAAEAEMVRAILRGSAKEHGRSILAEGLDISKRMSSEGRDPSIVIAAIVDELEGAA